MFSRAVPLRILIAAALVAVSAPAVAQVAAPAFRAGDSWTYRMVNNYNRQVVGTWTREVTSAAAGGIAFDTRAGAISSPSVFRAPGEMTSGVLGDRASGSMEPAFQLAPFPLTEGRSWSQNVVRTDPVSNEQRPMLVQGRVRGWETVKVPAGEFKAIKVERTMYLGDYDSFRGITVRTETEWFAPEVKGPVKLVVFEEYCERRFGCPMGTQFPGERSTSELTAYRGG
jgi:hypothetical protein